MSSEIANDEDGLVAEILELAQLAQHNRMAEVKIGTRRIDAELNAERPA